MECKDFFRNPFLRDTIYKRYSKTKNLKGANIQVSTPTQSEIAAYQT